MKTLIWRGYGRSCARCLSFLLYVLLVCGVLACGPVMRAQARAGAGAQDRKRQEAPAEMKNPSHEPGNAAEASNGAAPGQPTAPKPITALHLEKLPQPLPPELTQGIDVRNRSKVVLDHLSEVIRFYRMMATPIQKVGEPSDMVYAEQAQSLATQMAQLAFQSARDEAALLARIQGASGTMAAEPASAEAQRLRVAQERVAQQEQGLENQATALDKQIATAHGKARAALEQQKADLTGNLELLAAEQEALAKVAGISLSESNSGLQGEIDKLQHAVPEVVDNKVKPVANTMQSLSSLREAGVSSQGEVLFQLIATEHAIDDRVEELKRLHDQAEGLRTPLVNILRATVKEGQKLQEGSPGGEGQAPVPNGEGPLGKLGAGSGAAGSATPGEVRKKFDALTDAFKTISGVSVPISQEVLLLEQAQGNLLTWRAAVDAERKTILHSLIVRLVIIALALVLVLVLGEVWRRAATKYVGDLRRRRQILVIRRMVIGFLSAIVILLGFVTQFSSLATFAGFISAGIAVGLQTILLSVAAYFFIVGRYGVKVGDRITVANVTGDVVEVGLARFYMMELAGTGAELHPTGRVAVFANSVLFQTGTPLYKQIPGTNYAWHEMTVKLKPGVDYAPAVRAIEGAVNEVYGEYRARIEAQHANTEAWMDAAIPGPKVETRLRLTDGLQFTVLYPVDMSRAAEIDQKITQRVLEVLGKDVDVAGAVDGPPQLRAVVKS